MSDFWSEPANVPLLQWLSRGPLKHNLPQAVRLWVWLHLIYGSDGQQILLPLTFSYADCRAAFFTASHPEKDQKPGAHDPECPCQKSLAAWLFSPQLDWTQAQWMEYASQDKGAIAQNIEQWQASLSQADELPKKLDHLLHECQPFAVTRRALASDLKRLCELGWLKERPTGYGRVPSWPEYPSFYSRSGYYSLPYAGGAIAPDLPFLMQPDLAEIAANFSQEIGGEQRFFVHTDYVVPRDGHDRVEDWQDALREIWQDEPVVPLKLSYWSASRLEECEVVVYPVCLYYYRRGPYLCGWGQVPGALGTIDWRNYRLDRIRGLEPLDWRDGAVPTELKEQHQRGKLPKSEEIELRMSQAWGFDYYQPAQRLLVRFDVEWDQRYIRNSLRHYTFEQVSYEQAQAVVKEALSGESEQQKKMLTVLATRAKGDAYYQAMIRQDDPNVRQRMRAWRPHIEVLLPWSLRRRFAAEVAQEGKFYDD